MRTFQAHEIDRARPREAGEADGAASGQGGRPRPLAPHTAIQAEEAWLRDRSEAVEARTRHGRYVELPGREPVDLEVISDLWLD